MVALYLIVFTVAVGSIYVVFDRYRMRRIARERGDPDICAYAKSFDYRNIDTKIMREVWNEVQSHLGVCDGKPFPVKADDIFIWHFPYGPRRFR